MNRKLALLLMLALAACDWKVKPTYTSEKLAESLQHICKVEYRLDVKTRKVGDTLQAFYWNKGLLLPGQVEMKPETAKDLEGVLLCATRVSLSTDAALSFIQIKMADKLTGATISLWRYVPDIKESMYERLPEEEYFNRLVIEMDNKSMYRSSQPWDMPLTMEQFLGKQIVLRAKRQSPVSFQAYEDVSDPTTLGIVVENWALIAKHGAQDKDRVVEVVEKTAHAVLSGYRFKGFHEVVLKDARGSFVKSWAL